MTHRKWSDGLNMGGTLACVAHIQPFPFLHFLWVILSSHPVQSSAYIRRAGRCVLCLGVEKRPASFVTLQNMFNLSLPMAGRRAEETQGPALNRKTRQIYLCHYLLISFLRLSRMRQSNQDHHHMITSQFWPSVNRSSSEGTTY